MTHSYVAYIDEAGDEGFVFKPDGSGSTRWLVLSALVVRKENDARLVQLARQVRALLHKPPNYPLHFRNLKHEQRIPVARLIGESPVRTVSIVIHKSSMAEPENFQAAYSLYRYACRLLMERLSWLCRDQYIKDKGNGQVDLIFSNRSAMSYKDLRSYIEQLRGDPSVRIDWATMDPSHIRAINHDQMAGLQLADAVATGVFYAVNPTTYGETEPRYLQLMAPTLYKHKQQLFGYGLKLWCSDEHERSKVTALIQDQ